ncbi:ComEA family DNA-binding protein [Clostridium peptidivorans]|uniref:ComEA family DNA-binding protein n=1 Tax=Clostridium peptidivorans TaxID=100174 RepID=UPI000BE2B538|nr:helix-hairpin-helix domain-containing protein [Clostridium peptidivorans]
MEKKNKVIVRKILSLWWILLGFTLVFAGVGMYIAGRNVIHKRWKIYGIIYNIAIVGSSVLGEVIGNDNFSGIGGVLWIIFMVHSIKITKEYLIRREILSEADYKFNKEDGLKEKIRREYNLNNNMDEFTNKDEEPTNEFFKSSLSNQENIKQAEIKVDINHALEGDIAKIPSIGSIRAKKIVEIRNTQGAFKDLNDFAIRTDLKPHIVDKIRDNIYFEVSEENRVHKTNSNRVKRMVDMQ